MRWLDYPFYRILFFLLAGIVCSNFIEINTQLFVYGIGISFLLSILFLMLRKYMSMVKFLFNITVYTFFFFLGAIHLQFQNELSNDHFIHKQVQGQDHVLQLKLKQRLAPNKFNDRFYAEVIALDQLQVTGKTLVLFKRSDSLDFQVGDRLTVYDDVNLPAFERNPGDFDYRKYLKSIDVYGQIYVDTPKILSYENGSQELGFLLGLRNTILEKLEDSGLNENPRGVIEALVLGQRQNVDPEVTKSFRDAGVIHILALSGLHVGIILLILRILTKRILRVKYGRWIQSVVLIILLWSFALLTGMSPSIMRAVTMFSFVAIGLNLKRKGSVYHSLTLSAFVLLLFDPRLLFQVGFQLSYMAVFSIVLIQPVLAGLWTWRNKVKDFFWNIFTVTVAAQIGVAGISLFYFNQFPGLFILGNMLLLPVLPLIIGAALLLIFLLLLGFPTDWLTSVLNAVLEFIINTVARISSLDAFIIKDIYLTFWETALIYVALFSFVLFLLPYFKRSKRERFYLKKPNWMLHLSLLSLVVLFGLKSYEKLNTDKDSFLVLHQATGSAVSLSNQDQATLFTDLHVMDSLRAVNSLERLKAIETHRDKNLSLADLNNLIQYRNNQLLVIGENGLYDSSMKNATVLLSHSPKINLERLILEIQPKRIIADGSNYRNVVEGWKITCDKMGIDLLNTYEVGAVELMISND
ncbi:competence protein ComEC [Nonlabens dokdonensis]|uniref:ComEC/Rec2-related competence protein n=2 Tax=Nonlabens dokdonensis TaxID=328515 RepID=L7WE34_NONDD|nr:ComEC/Rec2 family competence protein [Nonlabens dokdonensis]AGC77163.1 ComEC/Rec2-related competence protein [Nonlabens dokdonensis DSW-6]PZX41121.1 competence protein ComEC [Nonlabens dokdonensis]